MARFLICTMYCGEKDFEHCVAAIASQASGHTIDHKIFSDLVEVDAHNEVYQAFNDAPKGTIRGKVDADVVLNPDALTRISMIASPMIWLDPETHDYFTDGPLKAGLAFYGDAVRFSHQHLTLKCDRDVASQRNPTHMGVLGRHAHYADTWTGFRYGFHRGLKSQLPIYDRMRAAHTRYHDPVRLAAIRGFELAQSDLYKDYHLGIVSSPMDHNYGDPRLKQLYEQYLDPNISMPPRTWR